MSSIGRYYARQQRRIAREEEQRCTWADGDWMIRTQPRVVARWHMWVPTADGPHCRFPRMTPAEWWDAAWAERDWEDWGFKPHPRVPDDEPVKRRGGDGPRVRRTRHTYTRALMSVSVQYPTELVIWLDQLVAGTPGGRATVLVPLLAAEKRRRETESV